MSELAFWAALLVLALALCAAAGTSTLARRAADRLRERWPDVWRALGEPTHLAGRDTWRGVRDAEELVDAEIKRLVRLLGGRIAGDPELAQRLNVLARANWVVIAVLVALLVYMLAVQWLNS